MDTTRQDLVTFLEVANKMLDEELNKPVSTNIKTGELFDKLDLRLTDEPCLEEDFQKSISELVLHTPKTASKRFFNQLFGGRRGKAVLGDLLAVMLNNSMYTYKVAGPQIGVEKEIIDQVISRIRYGENAGGTFPTGGSMSNFMALVMARDAFDSDIKANGVNAPLVAYTSKESHYSNAKNAAFAGVGRNNVRYIPTNNKGEMLVEALEEQIVADREAGLNPFFVNATAGTTVLGAFDPIDDIAEVCSKYNLWLHIDGAYCGSVLFSERYKQLIKGVEKSDSFSFNAHKMLGTPLTCSIILVKNKRHLFESFSNDASYLYQTDEDDFNPGKISFQCGRRNDALKFWTLWKSIGTKGLEQMVDKQFAMAEYGRKYVENHPDYELYNGGDSVSICFNYKGIDPTELCTILYEHEELVVGFGTFGENTFVRLVAVNSNNSEADILEFFNILEAFVSKHEHLLQNEVV